MEDNVGWTGGNVDDASENALIFTDRKPFRESKARYDGLLLWDQGEI